MVQYPFEMSLTIPECDGEGAAEGRRGGGAEERRALPSRWRRFGGHDSPEVITDGHATGVL